MNKYQAAIDDLKDGITRAKEWISMGEAKWGLEVRKTKQIKKMQKNIRTFKSAIELLEKDGE